MKIHKFKKLSPDPLVTVVIPVFNQENIIIPNLTSLANSMCSFWELILVDDNSKDDSLGSITRWISEFFNSFPRLVSVRVFRSKKELFETSCDSFGFSQSSADFLLEVQIDMNIYERGFDLKLIEALSSHDDLFMLSGRGVTTFRSAFEEFSASSDPYQGALVFLSKIVRKALAFYGTERFPWFKTLSVPRRGGNLESPVNSDDNLKKATILPTKDDFESTGQAGRLGRLIEQSFSDEALVLRKIWVGQTVMRGPLMIKRHLYESIGGFDTHHFFLGFDDHDLAYRGFRNEAKRCGYVPIGFDSPLSDGSTRKTPTISTRVVKQWRSFTRYSQRHASALWELSEKQPSQLPSPELREF